MSNPYDPYSSGQQPQQPADAVAPTQFVPVQPPQPQQQPAYGAPQDAQPWGRPGGQAPYGTPGQQQTPGQPYGVPQQQPAYGQQAPAYGQPPQQPTQPYGVPQQPPAFGQQPPAFGQQPPAFGQQPPAAFGQQPAAFGPPQGAYGYPTPVSQVKANRTGGAKIAGAIFGSILGRVLVAVVVIGGIAVFHFATSNPAHRDSNGNVSQAGSLGVADLKVGDCFNAPSSDTDIKSFSAVPCSQAHDSQVYAEPEITESTLPDDATLEKEASDDCDAAAKTGLSSTPAMDYDEANYVPQDEETFVAGDDYIVCAIQTSGKDLTESYVTGS